MIINETAAKGIACPFAKDFNADWTESKWRGHSPTSLQMRPNCMGSACMQWEWQDPVVLTNNSGWIGEDEQWNMAEKPERLDGESPEEMAVRYTKFYTERGFVLQPSTASTTGFMSPTGVSSWRRPHPNRRGQCGRTVIVEVSGGG